MATNSKVFVSPGVYTSERDLSFVSQSVGVTTLGIVGEALKGPAFEPIFITSYSEFETYFGGTSPEKFVNTQIPKYEASYIAKAYLQQSNQMFMTRILGLSGYDAGPSWSITTIANVDSSTVGFNKICTKTPNFTAQTCDISCTGVTKPFQVNFSGCNNGTSSISFLTDFPDEIKDLLLNSYTTNNGSTSTLDSDIKSQLSTIFAAPSTSASSIYYYGTIEGDDYLTLSSQFTAGTNVLDVSNVDSELADYTSFKNDAWYYGPHECVKHTDYDTGTQCLVVTRTK